MKTFRILGMALFAVLLSVNFVACGGSDDPTEEKEEENTKKTKKIVEVNCDDYDIYRFTYDNKGRLSSCTSTHGVRNRKKITEYSWSENSIKETWWWEREENEKHTRNYTLKNGLVTICGDDEQYSYNESKQLIYSNFADEDYELIWNDNKLVEAYNRGRKNVFKYGYSDVCSGYNINFISDWFNRPIHMAHPELFGLSTTSLPYLRDEENENKEYYAYTLDEDGYIIKANTRTTYESNVTFKWE